MNATTWNKIAANSNLIQQDTGRAVLIKVPKTDWLFWHPSKCVRTSGKSGYRMTISFTDSFEFKLFKNGKGRYNKFEKIAERTATASEIMELFGHDEG
jgi:hypothetical protein